MDAAKVIKILKAHDFKQISQKGSHLKLSKNGITVIVPIHGKKDIPLGTLKSIESQSGVKLR